MNARHFAVLMLLLVALAVRPAAAQAPSASDHGAAAQDTIMLTIFLRHDQSTTLGQMQQHLKETGFDQSFPPQGARAAGAAS